MADKYCYPNTDVLKNKYNIIDKAQLFSAEKDATILRVQELQENPVKGKFDFKHLKEIHKYIFQDIYEWAGETREVEIGKGNLFCLVANINSYAEDIFKRYFRECFALKNDKEKFVKALAKNYGDLNALHPFREGNGRTQREFARLVCLECGYDFSLKNTTHQEMLTASKLSFDEGDNSLLENIFNNAVQELKDLNKEENLRILTEDDINSKVIQHKYIEEDLEL